MSNEVFFCIDDTCTYTVCVRNTEGCLIMCFFRLRLCGWIGGAEGTVKVMEQSPTEETAQLAMQVKQIMVSGYVYHTLRIRGRVGHSSSRVWLAPPHRSAAEATSRKTKAT